MLTAIDQLNHYIDCSSLEYSDKQCLRVLVRQLDQPTAEALIILIDDLVGLSGQPLDSSEGEEE